MTLQSAILRKRLVTGLTSVRLPVAVDQHVPLKMAGLPEGLVTDNAVVREGGVGGCQFGPILKLRSVADYA